MTSPKYIEWFDAIEMHEHSKDWLSTLSFIKDEQLFLNNLITSFAIKPLDKKSFKRLDDFKKAIAESKIRMTTIFKQVQKHKNQLEIMIDSVNQLEMEKAYRKTHSKLFHEVNKFLIDFRTIKQRGFAKLSYLLKQGKTVGLANPDYNLRVSDTKL